MLISNDLVGLQYSYLQVIVVGFVQVIFAYGMEFTNVEKRKFLVK
ncbi:hypothetical protein PRVXT_002286 [Proteinivorax tanatarense]|uniref:Uncharacterized protein n=1 Tax=Proteinivorax tanatarense TaxID=1260629 RepID=A0AAU7VJP6_9FIRM